MIRMMCLQLMKITAIIVYDLIMTNARGQPKKRNCVELKPKTETETVYDLSVESSNNLSGEKTTQRSYWWISRVIVYELPTRSSIFFFIVWHFYDAYSEYRKTNDFLMTVTTPTVWLSMQWHNDQSSTENIYASGNRLISEIFYL